METNVSTQLDEAPEVAALIARGEELGCVNASWIEEVARQLELPEDDIVELEDRIEQRGIEITDDCGHTETAPTL
jgi:hypothetical protein